MRAIALAISSAVLAFVVGMPPLLLAQEPPAEEPPVVPEAPPAEEPPVVEDEESVPPDDEAPAPEAPPVYAAAAGAGSVSMGDNFFSPATITIDVGGTVTWANTGQEDHTATGSGFDTGVVAPGASASHTFTTAGAFPYVCALHADMNGTVSVLAGTGTDPGGDPGPGEAPPGTDPTGETDPTAVPGSEAAAGLEPGAAGTSSRLPASGAPQGALVALGIGLICCGLLATATARLREREILHLTDRWD